MRFLRPRIGSCVLLAAVAGSSCGAGASNPNSPTAALCQDLPQQASVTLGAVGGTVSAFVSAAPGCRWSAEMGAVAPWIAIQDTDTHIGPGTLTFALEPNRSFDERVGVLYVRDARQQVMPVYAVTQRGAGCLYAVIPETIETGSWGTWDGSGHAPIDVAVSAQPSTCSWTATSSAPWIFPYSSSLAGTGDGTVYIRVGPMFQNAVAREGTITIAGLSGLNPDAVIRIHQSDR